MHQWKTAVITTLIVGIFLTGCSSGDMNPLTPGSSAEKSSSNENSPTHLWGFYTISIDIENQSAEAVVNRNIMFSANVVNFINNDPSGLSFIINSTPIGPDYVDVDIDVMIKHPFPGMPEYDGYDVRGVFMGDGSSTMAYNNDLVYPVNGTDQYMFPDPLDGHGGPDGYSRWFNFTEFSTGGMPLFLYTQGNMATPGFSGTATNCPYAYFADGLGVSEDVFEWLNAHADQHGEFGSGSANTRNYYLRFPNDKGTVFGYAVIASWKGDDLIEDHPANAAEAVVCSVIDNSDVYYVDSADNGGDLVLNISLFNWDHQPSTIHIESSVLSAVEAIDPQTAATGGGDHYSTYHVEIPADAVTGTDGNEYWVIAEYNNFDYTNEFGVTNDADDDLLAAFFRYDLEVFSQIPNNPPVCDVEVVTSMPYEGWAKLIEFDASQSYDPDPGDTLTYSWDFNNDGVFGDAYDEGTPENPKKLYNQDYNDVVCVRVSDDHGGESECCTDPLDIIAYPTKNIDVTYTGREAFDHCIDHTNGDLLVLYENGMTRRYDYADYYQSYMDVPTNQQQGSLAEKIDIDENGYWMVAYYWQTGTLHFFRANHYTPSDTYQTVTHWLIINSGVSQGRIIDAFCMYDVGTRANTHVYPIGYFLTSVYYSRVYGRGHPPTWSSSVWWCNYNTSVSPSYGCGDYCMELITGGEADPTGDFVWFVEDDDYVAARWDVSVHGVLTYEGPCFGTSQTAETGQDGLWSPLDITVDNQGYMYVMDKVSDSPSEFSIKAFSYTSSGTTSFPNFGDGDDWDLDPIRIDGSQYNGHVVVLQSDGVNAKVSIFTEEETP